MHPVLVDRTKFEEQRLVKPLDDLRFALHGRCSLSAFAAAPERADRGGRRRFGRFRDFPVILVQ